MSEGIEQAPVRWLDEGTGRSPEQLGLVLQAQGSQNFVNGTVLCGVFMGVGALESIRSAFTSWL